MGTVMGWLLALLASVTAALCWFKGNPYRPVRMTDELRRHHEKAMREERK